MTAARPGTGASVQQELALLSAKVEAMAVSLHSLGEDMRAVRDFVMIMEAKDVVARLGDVERRLIKIESDVRDLTDLDADVRDMKADVAELKKIQTEASGMAKLARWLWAAAAGFSSVGALTWLARLFEHRGD